MLTYVMLTGLSPFLGEDKQETYMNISQGNVDYSQDVFHGISSLAMDFIQLLLHQNPRYFKKRAANACLKASAYLKDTLQLKRQAVQDLGEDSLRTQAINVPRSINLDEKATASKRTGPVAFPRSSGARVTHGRGHFGSVTVTNGSPDLSPYWLHEK